MNKGEKKKQETPKEEEKGGRTRSLTLHSSRTIYKMDEEEVVFASLIVKRRRDTKKSLPTN